MADSHSAPTPWPRAGKSAGAISKWEALAEEHEHGHVTPYSENESCYKAGICDKCLALHAWRLGERQLRTQLQNSKT